MFWNCNCKCFGKIGKTINHHKNFISRYISVAPAVQKISDFLNEFFTQFSFIYKALYIHHS